MCWRIVETAEYVLHGLHALYIRARLVVAATLVLGQSESPPGELTTVLRTRAYNTAMLVTNLSHRLITLHHEVIPTIPN
jgi:hypothetical protein